MAVKPVDVWRGRLPFVAFCAQTADSPQPGASDCGRQYRGRGTGKTPFIQWLGRELKAHGIRYGIVSRGYGGQSRHWPQWVTEHSDPAMVGDEPVLLAHSLQCPIAVSPSRPEAIALLESKHELDVIISDDGLQHFAMARDIEIVLMDAQRLLGNGLCLPAGPLREPKKRLGLVDYVVWNGGDAAELQADTSTVMELVPHRFRLVAKPEMTLPLQAFKGDRVNAVAGIGSPERFSVHWRTWVSRRTRRALMTIMLSNRMILPPSKVQNPCL